MSSALQKFWDKPPVRIARIAGVIAALAGIASFFFAPHVPDCVKGLLLAVAAVLLALSVIPWALRQLCRRIGSPEMAYAINSQRHGMSYEDLIVHAAVQGDDGSLLIRREMLVRAHSLREELDHYILYPEVSRQRQSSTDLPQIQVLDNSFKTISVKEEDVSPDKIGRTFRISPPLRPGECIRYQVIEPSIPQLYDPTVREMNLSEYDYFAWDIGRPTRRLELKVLFPLEVGPTDCELDVWYAAGHSCSRVDVEFERVKGLLQQRRNGDSLTWTVEVPHPVLGLTYVIKWPVRRLVVEKAHGSSRTILRESEREQ